MTNDIPFNRTAFVDCPGKEGRSCPSNRAIKDRTMEGDHDGINNT